MERFFDNLSRRLAEANTRRDALRALVGAVVGGIAAACYIPTETEESSSSSSSGGSCPCNRGYTYNFSSRRCCQSDYPYYYPGAHGGQSGCYRSCPYVGDCGTHFQAC